MSLIQGRLQSAQLTWQHGTTYFWGAMLLPPEQRRDVFAIYALCRLADDMVDHPKPAQPPAAALADFRDRFVATAFEAAPSQNPVIQAVAATVRRRQISQDCFDRFFDAMALDLSVTSWASWPDLRDRYMEGSAAAIGEMMLPVLEPLTAEAYQPARSLGLAFQLTNFIRDVAEDLDRGRVYLPTDELARHDADPGRRRVDQQWRSFLAEQIARNRQLYREAERGVAMLPPASANCIGTALVLYERILDLIEAADYDVFRGRIRVSVSAKARLAIRNAWRRH